MELKIGEDVVISNSETNEDVTWTIQNIAEDVITLHRPAFDPYASMDSIMGNGPGPRLGKAVKVVKLAEDGTIKTLQELWQV